MKQLRGAASMLPGSLVWCLLCHNTQSLHIYYITCMMCIRCQQRFCIL